MREIKGKKGRQEKGGERRVGEGRREMEGGKIEGKLRGKGVWRERASDMKTRRRAPDGKSAAVLHPQMPTPMCDGVCVCGGTLLTPVLDAKTQESVSRPGRLRLQPAMGERLPPCTTHTSSWRPHMPFLTCCIMVHPTPSSLAPFPDPRHNALALGPLSFQSPGQGKVNRD